jgi:tetratricopeptide (TPR) repeat protein
MSATRGMAAILVVLALLAFAATAGGCGGAEGRRASHLSRGQKYLADGRLEKARIEFANALQIAPNDPQARYLSGLAAERLGDPRAAAAMYQGAIDVDPGQVQARARLARLYVWGRKPEKALELVSPALKAHADDPALLTSRALARSQLKDPAGALADAERAVQLAPSDPEAVAALAALYRDSGHAQQAYELLDATIARLPDRLELREILARMYVADREYPQAEQQLLALIQARPREFMPRLQLAALYVRTKRPDDAERTLKAATSALPENGTAKLAYADFLATERPLAQAQATLRQLIAADPRNYDLQLRLGALQQRAGTLQDATATYRAIVARDPSGPKGIAARDRIAAIDVTSGKVAEARTLLSEALANNPHDLDALTLRGNVSLRDGNPVAAIADLRAVLHEQPGSVPILRTLARAHLANHEPTLAEENLRTALAAAPRDVGVRVDLGELLSRTHRNEQAVALLEETVRNAPDASGMEARVALIEAYLGKPDLPAARTAAEDLKTLRPELAAGPYLAGLVAQQQKRDDDAQREFERALQLQPAGTDALTALARLQFARGRHAQAIELVRAAAERTPGSAVVHELLGELYFADRNHADAVRALEEAARLAPGWWVSYGNLARAKIASGDSAGGIAAYEAGVKATQEPALVVGLAALYEQQGRIDEAIRQYELLRQHSPDLELAANNLAMLLVTYRTDQASLDRARDLTASFASSNIGALLDTHGWVMFKRGEVPEALSELQRASAQEPRSKVILYHLGMAQMKAGQTDKARASLEAALAGDSSFSGTEEARLALARLRGGSG